MSAITELTRAEADERGRLLQTDSYLIRLDLTHGPDVFRSETLIRFTAEPGATTFAELVPEHIHAIELNGRELEPGAVYAEGRIRLDALAERNELRVVADCRYTNTGTGLHRMTDPADGRVYLYTHLQVAEAAKVFACFDQPSLKARFTLSVTAPAGWQVFSTSPTPAEPDGDTWHFEPTPPLPTYAVALVAGEYHVVRDDTYTAPDGRRIPLAVACRASLAGHLDADEILHTTRQGLAHYTELFGPFPFAKYDQIFAPELNVAAMENAACVTVHENYVFRSLATEAVRVRRAGTILHEMAHMWFGNLVTMRWWDDLWLSESFATYASARCQAEATEWTQSWTMFANVEKTWAYQADQRPTTHPVVADIDTLTDVQVNFDGITYAKGAAVIKQLVAWVGDDAFNEAVRDYFHRHAWSNASLTDLLSVAAKSSGRDLAHWAGEWLRTAGPNTLRPELSVDAEGRFTSFAVLQEAPADHPVLRSHRIAVGLYELRDGHLERVRRVQADITGARTELPELHGVRRPDLVLLNDDDLGYTRVRFDDHSLATLLRHVTALRGPVQRAVCWYALWDMVGSAELPARAYLRTIADCLPHEADFGVAQVQQRQAQTAVTQLTAPAHRDRARDALAATWWRLLDGAKPGGDFQLMWARAFAETARADADLDRVAALLSGALVVPGLEVDAELRWQLLTALAAAGRADAADIDAEAARDHTAVGLRHAARAHAARPTAEAKAAAWESVVHHTDLPNAVQTAVAGAFSGLPQDGGELLRPYVAAYFEVLEDLWRERGGDVAKGVVDALFPRALVEEATLTATDAYLATHSPAPALRRLLLDAREDVSRALHARRHDERATAN
ncbi:aminopeptidase N [Streptomyces bicolor]|uniref:aminopeptidase N n=1 Tax=Streptomyces bicolor TaxID=66874 RepID=UPI0004E193AD|nr:aminopeptidase N [Streptomyces bicolor]